MYCIVMLYVFPDVCLHASYKVSTHSGGRAGGSVKSGDGGGVIDVIDRRSGGGGRGKMSGSSSGLLVLDTDEPADRNKNEATKTKPLDIESSMSL